MTKRPQWIVVVGLLVAVAAVSAQQSQAPAPTSPRAVPAPIPVQDNRQATIIRNVNLVDLLFSVVTKREKLITDLTKENFRVFDDGVPQDITDFSQPTDLPLRIGMVLDTSNSIRERLKFEQDAAIDFLFNALRRNKDEAFLMTFDDGGTSLYDAVYAASIHLLEKSPLPSGPNPDVRRVLVVISDGDDNSSSRS